MKERHQKCPWPLTETFIPLLFIYMVFLRLAQQYFPNTTGNSIMVGGNRANRLRPLCAILVFNETHSYTEILASFSPEPPSNVCIYVRVVASSHNFEGVTRWNYIDRVFLWQSEFMPPKCCSHWSISCRRHHMGHPLSHIILTLVLVSTSSVSCLLSPRFDENNVNAINHTCKIHSDYIFITAGPTLKYAWFPSSLKQMHSSSITRFIQIIFKKWMNRAVYQWMNK